MDRRALFFLCASAACVALVPVADSEHRPIALGVAVTYVVLALLSFLDFRSRSRR